MVARRILVSGRVQGVGYRAFAARAARDLGLVGWVRNLEDGDVEVWAEGTADTLDRLEAALQRGPAGARVDALRSTAAAPAACTRFEVRF
jgi:acylphosphatase